jgi:uncharacterized protein YbjT (DUF2867 family)
MSELHVILGAGQIGTMLAELLVQRGHRVRMVRRSDKGARVSGVELVQGDLADLAFAAELGRGAHAIYQCTNPIYTDWSRSCCRSQRARSRRPRRAARA